MTALQTSTNGVPSTVTKRSEANINEQFAQIIEIEVNKKKEHFVELWDQDQRLHRISLEKIAESVPTETQITGDIVLSSDGRYCLFAAELKVMINLNSCVTFFQIINGAKYLNGALFSRPIVPQ